MRQEFYRHKKSDGRKWFFTALLFTVIIAALVLGGLQLFGKGKAKPSEWFAKKETEIVTEIPDEPAPEIPTQNE